MIVLSNTTEQTLQPGQSITFNEVILHSGCGECFRENSSQVKLRGTGIYSLEFSGNIGGPTAATPVQLAITLAGSPLLETTMISTPAAITDRNNVATATRLKNCCGDFDVVSVTNTGTVPVIVGVNSSFVIERHS